MSRRLGRLVSAARRWLSGTVPARLSVGPRPGPDADLARQIANAERRHATRIKELNAAAADGTLPEVVERVPSVKQQWETLHSS